MPLSTCRAERVPPDAIRRIDIVGAPVDAVSLEETCGMLAAAVRSGTRLHIVTLNVDFVMRARRDREFREWLWHADLLVPDGVPICWAAALQGEPLSGRVNGTQLVWECARLSAIGGFTIGLVGGGAGAAEGAAEVLRERFPGSRIEVIDTPDPVTPADSSSLVDAIRTRRVDVLLVALGTPKQEYWLDRHLGPAAATVGIGVGASFDFISGRKARAPAWMQRSGLEWLFRFLHEPRRLGRRYFIDDLPFTWLSLGWAARRRLRRILRR